MAKEPFYLKVLKIPLQYSGWLLIALALALGAYITFQSYLTAGTIAVDEIMRQVNMKLDNGIGFQFRLNSPEGKPIVLDKFDSEILLYDYKNSTLEVDGVKKNLWEGTFNYSVNRRGKTLFYTTSFPFEKDQSSFVFLEEVVSFENQKLLKVEHYFIFTRKPESNYEVKNVKLILNHLPSSSFSSLNFEGKNVSGSALVSLRKAQDSGVSYIPFTVKIEGSLQSLGESEFNGEKGFSTESVLNDPETSKRTLISREFIEIK